MHYPLFTVLLCGLSSEEHRPTGWKEQKKNCWLLCTAKWCWCFCICWDNGYHAKRVAACLFARSLGRSSVEHISTPVNRPRKIRFPRYSVVVGLLVIVHSCGVIIWEIFFFVRTRRTRRPERKHIKIDGAESAVHGRPPLTIPAYAMEAWGHLARVCNYTLFCCVYFSSCCSFFASVVIDLIVLILRPIRSVSASIR